MTDLVPPDPTAVVVAFNESINGRDIDGLAALMSEDHTFIDTEGRVMSGRPACLAAWRGFFAAFPDYRNIFSSVAVSDDVVAITGRSLCAEPSLSGPALWTATVREGTVARWRVYDDTPENRRLLALPTD